MFDQFAQHRKTPLKPVASPDDTAPAAYVAFDAKDRVSRIKIRRKGGLTHAESYACLPSVFYDEGHGTRIVLVFTHAMVLIRGKNLKSVGAALAEGTADFIQEYDAKQWPRPTVPLAPFIESINMVAEPDGSDLSDAELSFDPPAKRKLH